VEVNQVSYDESPVAFMSKQGMGNEMISCEADNGCGRSLRVGEFSAQNETVPLTDEDIHSTFEMSCSFEEYKKFESFFLKFLTVARDFYLPPQRQRYGLVSERLLLSPLGIEVSDQWCLIVSYAGCPGCLKVLKEGSHLHDAIERHDLPVMEVTSAGEQTLSFCQLSLSAHFLLCSLF